MGSSCISNVFCCCYSKKKNKHHIIVQDLSLLSNLDENHSKLDEDSEECCFEDDWIRNEEKSIIKYTKGNIMKLINDQYETNEGFEELHNKDNLILSAKTTGSPLYTQCTLLRITYVVPLNQYPTDMTLEEFWSYICVPEKRLKWDKGLKEYKIIKGTDEKGILYKWSHKPIVIVSERDSVEKMIRFRCPKGDLYTFLSSVNDEFMPISEDVVRTTDWMSGYCFSKDETNLYIKYLSQIDMKMITPNTVIKFTIPNKMKEWYNLMKDQINTDYQSKENNKNIN